MNFRNEAKSITIFDFSTLHAKLAHDKLRTVLQKLIDFCFDGEGNNFILLNDFGTHRVKEKVNKT